MVEKGGVIKLTKEIYESQIFTKQQAGSKPWVISIINRPVNGKVSEYSTFMMKTLYFLQQNFKEDFNVAWLDTHDEYLREAFDNDGLPQTVYIRDGKPYYLPWDTMSTVAVLKFILKYEARAVSKLIELGPVRSSFSIYP